MSEADAVEVQPLDRPPDTTVTVPGSKSITNRALVCALLAGGRSVITGALLSDDTEAMAEAARRLGATVTVDEATSTIAVDGVDGQLAPGPTTLDARLSGTTSRFLLPVLAAGGSGTYRLDGAEPLRRRPLGPLVEAVRALGGEVVDLAEAGHLPLEVRADGLTGGTVRLPGNLTSQYLTALLLAAPLAERGVRVELTTELVSRPYLELTAAVMDAFGAELHRDGDRVFAVRPGSYRPADHRVEPDASAASYFFAAAAICGGRVRVEGLGQSTRQGDARFVDLLEQMGCEVERAATWLEVRGTGTLRGLDVDLADLPDVAQTLAAVAVFADGPTRITGIGFTRHHETDRVANVVGELRRLGLRADEEADGYVLHPGTPRPGTVRTHHDHRMAMSFALLGLRAPGIRIADPTVVNKTFPGFFDALRRLRPH